MYVVSRDIWERPCNVGLNETQSPVNYTAHVDRVPSRDSDVLWK